MKLIFDFLDMADWWCTNNGFLAAFLVTLKSSSDSEWPLGVVSGFSISNFNLGCWLFIIWWNWFTISSLVVWI